MKEGIDSSSLERIAVKIINKKRARKSNGGLENVYREIEMLRRVNKSKHVIGLLDVYCQVEDEFETKAVFNWFRTIEDEPIIWIEDDGSEVDKTVSIIKFYLVFDYCPSTLQVLIDQNGCLSVDYARKLLIQIAEGIQFLHSMGVIRIDSDSNQSYIYND